MGIDVDALEKQRGDLERDGYDVETSAPGRAALTRALQYWPDIVVVRGDRRRFESLLHSNPYLTHIKVIRCNDRPSRSR